MNHKQKDTIMGCDIHTSVEKKLTINGEEKWYNTDYFKLNPYYGDGKYEDERRYQTIEVFGDRNYRAFSHLCGVRGNDHEPRISEPKGVPDDCSPQTKEEIARWGCDGHSHSYVTLKEVMDFVEANTGVGYQGYISPEAAEELSKGVLPDYWCVGTSDNTWVFRKWRNEEYSPLQGLIEVLSERLNPHGWMDDEKIRAESDKIRLVFWFGN